MSRGPEGKYSQFKENYKKIKTGIENGIILTAEELHAYKKDVTLYRDHARKKRINFYKNVRRRVEPVAAPIRAYKNDFLYYKYRFEKRRDSAYDTVAYNAEVARDAIAQPTLPQVLGAVGGTLAVTAALTFTAIEGVRYALEHHDSPAGSSAPQLPGNSESNNPTHHTHQPKRIQCETMLPGYNYLCKGIVRHGSIVIEVGNGDDFAYPHNGKGAQIEFPVRRNGTGTFSLPNGERLQINRKENTIFIHKVS